MTQKQAKSELEAIYMSLSEEKKKALDVAFKAMEQADGEKTCGTCRNEDTYHCAECENKSDYEQAQADGEYISKQAVLENIDQWYEDKADIEDLIVKITYIQGVAIPTAEPKYCDRNICLKNEYNNIGCAECEVTKSQKPCEDAISRKSIKHKLQEHHDFFVNAYGGFSNLPQNDKSRVDEILNCIAMVVNEPPVNPQPKTGHWEYNQYDGNPNIGNWHCSECRNIVSDMPTCMGKPLYEFCPHCGSPMEIER